jgi:hypothetical protein
MCQIPSVSDVKISFVCELYFRLSGEDYKHKASPAKDPSAIEETHVPQVPDLLVDEAKPVLLYSTAGIPTLDIFTPSSTLQITLQPHGKASRLISLPILM